MRVGLVLLSFLSVVLAVWFSTTGANLRSVIEHSLQPSSPASRAAPQASSASPAGGAR